MAHKKKGNLTTSPEWAKHLRRYMKKQFWRAERNETKSLIKEELMDINNQKPIHSLNGKSMRPFIGSKDYSISRSFYKDLGFEEIILPHKMCYFHTGAFGFYLQDAYVKDWVDNSMIFFEVEDLQSTLKHIRALKLTEKYDGVRVSEIVVNDWGDEFFLHDPSGNLWHIGMFK